MDGWASDNGAAYPNVLEVVGGHMERGVLVIDQVTEVVGRFEKEIGRKELNTSGVRYCRLFNKMMDECQRLGLNPFINYEAKLPVEE